MKYKTHSCIKRYKNNPVLTAQDVPYDSLLVFNAGVTKFNREYIMIFRNDYGNISKKNVTGTNLGLARSQDGFNWSVDNKPFFDFSDKDVKSVNDPRLTVLDERLYITFAMIAKSGVRGGIAVTDNLKKIEMVTSTVPDNRNLVLFPEKINGMYFRLERPFANYLRDKSDQFDIWISSSPDLKYWGNPKLLLKAADVNYCNNKIGPGTPPVKTERGWLSIFHAVDEKSDSIKNGWENSWDKTYMAGIMLLDPDNPEKIIGVYDKPLIVPETDYETKNGFRNNVIFPCGIIVEDNSEVKIYYGAADSLQCLATARLEDLINLCL